MLELGQHHVGYAIVDLGADEDDPLREQPGVDVRGPLAERGLLHHRRNRVLAHDHSPAILVTAGRTSSSRSTMWSMIPYSRASSALNQRSRRLSRATVSSGCPVCFEISLVIRAPVRSSCSA